MKIKNVLLMGLSLVLVAALSIGGTVAFLTATDSDVNVMTAGSVKIAQNEYEYDRENEKFVEFKQNKPALPAVFSNGTLTHPTWAKDANGSEIIINLNDENMNIWSDDDANIIDKFVTVKNEGNTDIFFRTIIAVEVGDIDVNSDNAGVDATRYFRFASNYDSADKDTDDHFDYYLTRLTDADGKIATVEINGQKYMFMIYTHKTALADGVESTASLRQLALGHGLTSKQVASLGTNWDVVALSQAVQASGFDSADAALTKGFGEVTAENVATWFAKVAPTDAAN